MDVTGLLGGYNIHWALASAFAAVKAMTATAGGRGRKCRASSASAAE